MNTMETHTHQYTHTLYRHTSTGIVMRHDKRYDLTAAPTVEVIAQTSGSYELLWTPKHTCTQTLPYLNVFSPAFVSHTQASARWGKDEVNHICLIYIPVTWLKSTVGIRCVSTSQSLVSVERYPSILTLKCWIMTVRISNLSACTTFYSSLGISQVSFISLCIMYYGFLVNFFPTNFPN